MLPPALAHGIVVLVSLVWFANFLGPLVFPEYVADPQLNVVFMSIVGGALALSRKRGSDDE